MAVFITGGGVVPAAVELVNYIEPSGTQYIKIPFKPNSNTRVRFTGRIKDLSSTYALFGARNTKEVASTSFLVFMISGKPRLDYGFARVTSSTSAPSTETVFDFNKNILTFNGTTVTASSSTFSVQYEMMILSVNNGGSADERCCPAIVKSVEVYDNATLKFNLVPAKLGGVYGLYDTIGGNFYGSLSQDAFTGG